MDDKLQTTPDKGLVTAEMVSRATLNHGSKWQSLADALNAALAPLIELEVAKALLAEQLEHGGHMHGCPVMSRGETRCKCGYDLRVGELARLAGEQTTVAPAAPPQDAQAAIGRLREQTEDLERARHFYDRRVGEHDMSLTIPQQCFISPKRFVDDLATEFASIRRAALRPTHTPESGEKL